MNKKHIQLEHSNTQRRNNMLVSQKIAASPTFLNSKVPCLYNMFEFRGKIMKATKFVIPGELIDLSGTTKESIFKLLEINSVDQFSKAAEKKFPYYLQYCKMPFSSILLENDTAAYYLEETSDGHISFILIDGSKGTVHPVVNVAYWWLDESGAIKHKITLLADPAMSKYEKALEQYSLRVGMYWLQISEILLFINTKNVTKHNYKPTQKELSKVPKNFRSFYDYHVLDIFHEVNGYTSLAGISEQLLVSQKNVIERRAHLVRGHYKTLKTGLFWWSPHARCRKNAETIGVIEKDYQLVV